MFPWRPSTPLYLIACVLPAIYIHTPPPMTGGTGAPLIILSLFQFHTPFTSHYRQTSKTKFYKLPAEETSYAKRGLNVLKKKKFKIS